MVIAFTDPYDCPIYNYFRSKEDLSFLLKKRRKLNNAEMAYLATVYFDLTEWYSQNIAKDEYTHNLDKWKRKYELMVRIEILLRLKKVLSKINTELSDKMELFEGLFEILKHQKCKIKQTVGEQISEIERVIKITTGQQQMEAPKKHTGEVNWVEQVVVVGNVIGQKINAKETTLAEWCEYVKMANKQSRNERN
jgi:hypothetical protein